MRKFSAAALGLLVGVPVLVSSVKQEGAPSSQMEVIEEPQAAPRPPIGGLRATTARLAGFPQWPSGSTQLGRSVGFAGFLSDKTSPAKSWMVASMPMGSAQQHIDRSAAGAAHRTGFLQKHVGGFAAGAAHRASLLQLRNFQQLNGPNNQQHHTGPGPNPKSLATSWMGVPAPTPRSMSWSHNSGRGTGTRSPSPSSGFLANAVDKEREDEAASASSVAPTTCKSYQEAQGARSGDGWMAVADQCAISAVVAQFLSQHVGKPFCVLAAVSAKVLGATEDWLEAAGVTWDDALAANSLLGIRSLVRSPFSTSDSLLSRASSSSSSSHFEHRLYRALASGAFFAPPTACYEPSQLLRYLLRPDDAWDPVDTTSGEGLKLNRTPNRLAAPVKFRGQWHKKGGYHYTGSVGISRLICEDKKGECPVAYLLHLRCKEEIAQASTLGQLVETVDEAAWSAILNANGEFLRQGTAGGSTTADCDEMALARGIVEEWSDDEATGGDGESGTDCEEGEDMDGTSTAAQADEDMDGISVAVRAMSLKRNREANYNAEEKAEHIEETGGRRVARRRREDLASSLPLRCGRKRGADPH